ncbi:LLM class flavin-dependent oxidoreductase [Rhizobium leguminosarum]|uniref:LLM class flavin-dependent oxidoreductase n=1 Tax=Rhizobium leguminosarum TaxID=384 RepID=UPI001C965E5E|nr:LLM class flavin-dependent oxidoreductase [Rhizobium leguminosarum]MBY5336077.1 LLM class flavin-dependent oxidoreductase [Rhizobium leguminosarum]
MKFCYFNHMPWRHMTQPCGVWPYERSQYDAIVGHEEFTNFFEQVTLAEESGFDWVAFGEEHSTPFGVLPNSSLACAIAARITKRVRIAALGYPVPLLNPLRLAEECAWLDVMSAGRLEVGLLRGVPQSYVTYNIDPSKSWARFEQGVELVMKAWMSDDSFSWSSSEFEFPTVAVWPRCLQKPHPPILFSAGSERSLKLAATIGARVGQVHLVKLGAVEEAATAFANFRRFWREAGRLYRNDDTLLGLYACIADSRSEARDLLNDAFEYMRKYLSGAFRSQKQKIFTETGYAEDARSADKSFVPGEELTIEQRIEAGLVICGTPAEACDQIARLKELADPGILSLHFQVGNMAHKAVCKSIAHTGKYIIPAFRN